MPRAQAGVAAGIASTSRQVGASLGVAVGGSIVGSAMRTAVHPDFAAATRVVWWLMALCGAAIVALAFASTSAWARATARRVAYLVDDPDAPASDAAPAHAAL
jgi:hypothetical protein